MNCEMRVRRLGTTLIENPKQEPYTSDTLTPIHLDSSFFDGTNENMRVCSPMFFEKAGTREKIYFEPSKTKVAIVTCGGLCPGLNDVIRATVMELYHGYGVRDIIGIRYGLEGFIASYGHDFIQLTPDFVSDIHTFGGTVLGTSRGAQSFEEIAQTLEREKVNILFVLGGDGSMRAALAISEAVEKRGLDIAVIGIPKTIDNDINFVPQSFGFATAVDTATEALACAHTEARGMFNGIGLVKLMGRESGFIAAQTTLALSVVNFVLVPESPFTLQGSGGFLDELEKRLLARTHAVIVVAEGAGQDLLESTGQKDASGNIILQDIGSYLEQEIKKYFKEKQIPIGIKYIDPSYMIRACPANTADRVYCGFLGRNAVHAAMSGRTNMVIARLMDTYVHLPFHLVTAQRRKVNIHTDYWASVLAATGQTSLVGV